MSGAKLLIYTHAMAGGGAERVCAHLASGFARRGWRVVLAVDAHLDANDAFLDPAVDVHVLGTGHLRAVWRLARLLRRERPDASLSAIGVSNVKHVAAAALCGRLGRAVLSYHAFAASEPQRLSRAAFVFAPALTRLAARTVAVSRGLRQDLVDRWGADPRRTVTIYNPVLVGPDRDRPGPGAAPVILAAGRLVPEKNMRGLLRAFARVAVSHPAHLVILGEGPERTVLEEDVASLGLEGRVHLPGYMADPWPLYRTAACFATASRLESFSMVVAEALAYGLPVVATDSPGPREVLADGQFGTLVPPDDEAALAEALRAALTRPDDAARLRARGAVFSVEAALEGYGRLFAAVRAEAAGRWGARRRMGSAGREVG